MIQTILRAVCCIVAIVCLATGYGQISKLQDYQNFNSAPIGTFQGINFREGGFSGLFPIPNTYGKEFWTISDRGVNVDAANAILLAVVLPTIRFTHFRLMLQR